MDYPGGVSRDTGTMTTPTGDNDRMDGDSFLPDFCSVRVVLLVVLIAELIAFIMALAPVQPSGDRWGNLGMISLFVQWVGLSCAALLCAGRRWLRRAGTLHATLYGYAAVLLVTALFSELALQLNRYIGDATPITTDQHTEFLLRNLALSVIVATVALRYFYLQYESRRHIEAVSQARLEALQARIRPHFLFNSMNTIASLTRRQPDVAERVVEDLADLFRATLGDVRRMVTLHEELDLARRYLNIESLRLGHRLAVEWDAAQLPADALVPAFTIQPLIENAVYHGIEPAANGGTVRLHGDVAGGRIRITVTNPLASATPPHGADAPRRDGNQMALANIRARLEACFGADGTLRTTHDNGHFTVTVTLPYRTGDIQ